MKIKFLSTNSLPRARRGELPVPGWRPLSNAASGSPCSRCDSSLRQSRDASLTHSLPVRWAGLCAESVLLWWRWSDALPVSCHGSVTPWELTGRLLLGLFTSSTSRAELCVQEEVSTAPGRSEEASGTSSQQPCPRQHMPAIVIPPGTPGPAGIRPSMPLLPLGWHVDCSQWSCSSTAGFPEGGGTGKLGS